MLSCLAVNIDDVIEIAPICVPEARSKVLPYPGAELTVLCSIGGEAYGPAFHDSERNVPESIDFNGFAAPGSHYPIVNFGIHPCQLQSRRTGMEQAIMIVDAYSVTCSTNMPIYNILENWEEFFQQ